jgi:hypothetical protein
MSGLNDRDLHWFPRDGVNNHALEIIDGMRRECGAGLTMTRHRALRHTRNSRSCAAASQNASECFSDADDQSVAS